MVCGSKLLRVSVLCLALTFVMNMSGCNTGGIAGRPVTGSNIDVERLVSYMCGHFSSANQAAADPDFRDISLKVIRVWEGREDPQYVWLYVEQAMASDLAHPYRQRLYRVSAAQGCVQSDVYSLPAPEAVVGAWRDVSLLDSVAVRDLSIRQGCSVYLTVQGEHFVGGTHEQDCPSDLSGARYATSHADIGPDGMVTWDRGFDVNGKQVWGSAKGGYRFDKLVGSGAGAVRGEIRPAK